MTLECLLCTVNFPTTPVPTFVYHPHGITLCSLNPISGRLLATPISGKGGLFRTPLEISGSNRSIFKIQMAFVSPQYDLHF